MTSFLISILLFLTVNVSAHGSKESRVTFQSLSQGALKAGKIEYKFELYDSKTKTKISDQDLVDSHTKKIHFIAYDASLNEFNHVHPEFDGKNWKVELTLPVNGRYFFWVQGELKDTEDFSVSQRAEITGGEPARKPIKLKESRQGADGLTKVTLSEEKLKAGEMAMLIYKVTRQDGKPAKVTPYLGANAHVIAVSPNGSELIHVHPMDGSSPGDGMLHATFPTVGAYRIWVQLVDDGILRTIPISVTVMKAKAN